MALVAVFLVLTLGLATQSAYAVEYTVGDNNGWTDTREYTTWVAGKTFNVGDTLLFRYTSNHGVNVITKSDYDNCVTSSALNSYSGGTTRINLTQPGPMYFACPTFGHCRGGMKLAINVVFATQPAYAVEYTVGDNNGWTDTREYTTWAAGKTFYVGDRLLFRYTSNHGVNVITKSDYDNCVTSSALNSYRGGTTRINLTQPGPMYFACPTFGHCRGGMKLAINVVSASRTPTTTVRSGGSTNSAKSMVVGFALILAVGIVV